MLHYYIDLITKQDMVQYSVEDKCWRLSAVRLLWCLSISSRPRLCMGYASHIKWGLEAYTEVSV